MLVSMQPSRRFIVFKAIYWLALAVIALWGVLWLISLVTGDTSAVENRKTVPWLAPAVAAVLIFGFLTRKQRK